MDSAALLITGMGLAVSAGLNAYIPMLVAGLLIRFDVISFEPPYDLLGSTPSLVLLTVLVLIELVADKVPAVDSANDAIQTLIRPVSGALLFAATVSGADWQWAQALAVIVGLLTALGVHATKASVRPVVNVSTAGVGGPVVSTVEDGISFGLSLAALLAPLVALVVLVGLAWAAWSAAGRIRARRAGG